MPEIKNTFLRSKMNKDLDSRIIPNGEYRNAENISISTSEGSDVGALENIRGNIEVTDFGLQDSNLKIIGSCVDDTNNRIFFFITNHACVSSRYSSSSGEEIVSTDLGFGEVLNNTFTKSGSKHYIAIAKITNSSSVVDSSSVDVKILVSGDFLNFSTLSPILSTNIIENLLFWTDDRNQPRKINVDKAIENSFIPNTQLGYYNSEDHVSVAKYAPYTSISFLEELIAKGPWLKDLDENEIDLKRTTLKNEVDEYLPAHIIAPGSVSSDEITIESSIGKTENSSGVESNAGINDFLFDLDINGVFTSNVNIKVTCQELSGEALLASVSGNKIKLKTLNQSIISDISGSLGWSNNVTLNFQSANPDYNKDFVGDKDFLKEKFIRFSYRFKYDDGEYSIIAPFSQHAFIPKQYGHFIGDDAEKTAESSIVDFMENQVTTAGLIIDLPCPPNKLKEKLHIEEIQLLYKASDEQSVKVIADIIPDNKGIPEQVLIHSNGDTGYDESIENNNQHDFTPVSYENESTGTGEGMKIAVIVNADGTISTISKNEFIGFCVSSPGHGYRIGDILTVRNPETPNVAGAKIRIEKLSNKYYYNYKSQKPIKVLPEKEIVRVSDIVPIKAKTQEAVGNRIIYGNFLQNNKTPNSLRYKVGESDKGIDPSLRLNEELINHTLKQNRTYQVGIVLQDRYGRASNVIVNNDTSSSTSFTSTYFSPYTNGGVDPLSWPGNSLNVIFEQKIDTEKTSDYNGVWSETNPLGWYSYKIVVKQQEQDYYNVYVPGSLTGNVVFTGYSAGGEEGDETPLTYSDEDRVSHIVLFNDNINKIPRDLNKVGPSDRVYSSNVVLHNRVNNKTFEVSNTSGGETDSKLSEQTRKPGIQTVTNIRPFGEMGDWTKYKNVDLHYLNMGASGNSQYPESTFIYPGAIGNVDPLFLENNKNPLVATLKTDQRIGYTSTNQESDIFKFSKFLTIFETEPVKSEIDIYYETSSSGTIEDFNNRINDVLSGDDPDTSIQIGSITDIKNIEWIEDMEVDNEVSGGFKAQDLNGNTISDSTVEIEIVEWKSYRDSDGQTSGALTLSDCPIKVDRVEPAISPFIQAEFILKVARKIAYPYSTNYDSIKLKLEATSSNSTPFTQEVTLSLTNIKPFIKQMTRPSGASYSSSGGTLFNFNSLSNGVIGFVRENGLPLDNGSSYRNGFLSRNRVATNNAEAFNVNSYAINIYSETKYTEIKSSDGRVPIAIFEKTSNGSVISSSVNSSDSTLVNNSGSLIDPESRLKGLNNADDYLEFKTTYSGLEVKTCKFNKSKTTDEGGPGTVFEIGFKDDDDNFAEKFLPNGGVPFEVDRVGNKFTVYCTSSVSGALKFSTPNYTSRGDRRVGILITLGFEIIDASGLGFKSEKYIARTLIFKGGD